MRQFHALCEIAHSWGCLRVGLILKFVGGGVGAGVDVVCMHRPSACGLYTYILALKIHDGSAYRPSSG